MLHGIFVRFGHFTHDKCKFDKKHNRKHPPQGSINKYFFVLVWFLASSRQKIETETLRGGVDFHEVCISVVETPHHFYVQKADSQKE